MTQLAKDIGPLDWRIAITDKNGRPTPEFQRRWNSQRNNNSLIGTITFGAGPPPASPAPADGVLYADTSNTPYTIYIGDGGTWHKAGVQDFTELLDVPHAYTGTGHYLVRVKASVDGLEFVDPTTIIPQPANPTATAGPTAINGTATSFMRSDAAPAIRIGSATQTGLLQPDGTTIQVSSGVINARQATLVVNGICKPDSVSCTINSFGTLSVPTATSSVFGLVRPDNTTITITAGVLSSVGGGSSGANPTASAGPTAINGVATTFMRSDAAPAVQLGTSGQKGIVQVDNTTITATAGVITAATATSSTLGVVKPDNTTITITGGILTSVGAANAWIPLVSGAVLTGSQPDFIIINGDLVLVNVVP